MDRKFVFTWNNWTEESKAKLELEDVQYMQYAEEIAPDTGTPHLQGCLYYKNKMSIKALRKRLKGAHVDIMHGTLQQSIDYCVDGPIYKKGTPPATQDQKGEKEKDRWREAFLAAEEGRFEDVPYDILIRYSSSIRSISEGAFKRPRLEPIPVLENYWIVGPSGSGKTTMAKTFGPYYRTNIYDNATFQKYNWEENVIFEDFDKRRSDYVEMFKNLADHDPITVRCLYGTKTIRPKRIIVTSNYTIDDIWKNPSDTIPMHRRFKTIFTTEQVPSTHATQQCIQSLQ